MGTRYRLPRKVKKAREARYRGTLTPKQHRWLSRCSVMQPLGWRGVRHANAHVAMGDTTTMRRREQRERERLTRERQDDRRRTGRR